MDAPPPKELTIEEFNDLAIKLLRGLWIAQVRTLVDAAGSKATIEAMTPYFTNSAHAGTLVTKRLLGFDKCGAAELAEIWGLQNACMGFDHVIIVHEDGLEFITESECPLFEAPAEICTIYDIVGGNASLEVLGLDWKMVPTGGYPFGGPFCKGQIGVCHLKNVYPKSSSAHQGKELFRNKRKDFEDRYSLSLRQSLSIQYYAEFAVQTTNAALDALGDKAFNEIMCPAILEHGKDVGRNLLNGQLSACSGGASLQAIDMVNRALKQTGTFKSHAPNIWGREICECPFSLSTKEFCMLFQNFLDGISKAYDPASNFSYARCMTAGASSCFSELKVSQLGPFKRPSKSYDEHLTALKMRLAKGEIGEDDYFRLKRLILEDQ